MCVCICEASYSGGDGVISALRQTVIYPPMGGNFYMNVSSEYEAAFNELTIKSVSSLLYDITLTSLTESATEMTADAYINASASQSLSLTLVGAFDDTSSAMTVVCPYNHSVALPCDIDLSDISAPPISVNC